MDLNNQKMKKSSTLPDEKALTIKFQSRETNNNNNIMRGLISFHGTDNVLYCLLLFKKIL